MMRNLIKNKRFNQIAIIKLAKHKTSNLNKIYFYMYVIIESTTRDSIIKPKPYEPSHEKTNTVVPNRSDSNQAVQSQKQARSLKFWI